MGPFASAEVHESLILLQAFTGVLAAYIFLEEEQARLGQEWQCAPTIGEARCAVQRVHQRHLLAWLQQQFQAGATPEVVAEALAA